MKARIVKKLSKRLAEILAPEKYQPKHRLLHNVWMDSDYEHPGYSWRFREDEITPKQRREHYQANTSIKNVPSVGGEYDSYIGDCSDHCTVLEAFTNDAPWIYGERRMTTITSGPLAGDVIDDYPDLKLKLTGKNLVMLAKRYEQENAA